MTQHVEEGLSQQIAVEFRRKIERGEWPVGGRIPTTRELAARYHVSVNTIQTAFRELKVDQMVDRRPRIGGCVKARYRHSSGLRTVTTIGVVSPYSDIALAGNQAARDEWGNRIVRAMDLGLASSGCHCDYFSYSAGNGAMRRVLEKIDQAGQTLGGVLCFLGAPVKGITEELDRRNLPWITVNRPRPFASHNFVSQDAFSGSRLTARCCAQMGYDRIAILSDALGLGRSTGDKFYGFMTGWVESGMPSGAVDFLSCETWQEEIGHDVFVRHVEAHGPPRAVFAAGDLLALGAIRACRELGLTVPDQVAVIGSTGLQLAAYSDPTLTVLNMPLEQMGADAAQMLLEMAREGVRRVPGRYVKAELAVRESCPIPADLLERERAALSEEP